MDNDLDLGRYAAGLRRHAAVIAIAAAIGLALGIVVARSSAYSATIQFQAVPRFLDLISVGLDANALDVPRTVDVIHTKVNDDAFESELAGQYGDIEVLSMRDPELPSITVSLSGSDPDQVARAIAGLTASAQSWYTTELSVDIERVRIGTETRKRKLTSQIAEIDTRLAGATAAQRTLVEGLLVERQVLSNRQEGYESILDALDRFESSVGEDLQATTIRAPERASVPMFGALGLLAAGGLAVAASLARTASDRSVRCRRDLALTGLTDLIGVIPRPTNERAAAVTRRAIDVHATTIGSTSVQVVPLTQSFEGHWLTRPEVDERVSFTLAVRPPLSTSADAVIAASQSGLSILAIEWGVDSRTAVVRVANELGAAGAGHVAVLLYGVPPREVEGVER